MITYSHATDFVLNIDSRRSSKSLTAPLNAGHTPPLTHSSPALTWNGYQIQQSPFVLLRAARCCLNAWPGSWLLCNFVYLTEPVQPGPVILHKLSSTGVWQCSFHSSARWRDWLDLNHHKCQQQNWESNPPSPVSLYGSPRSLRYSCFFQ